MAEMLSKNLFEEILLSPAESDATDLLIVSGYASSSMAHRHLAELVKRGSSINVQLIYGMAKADGVSLADDEMFARLQAENSFQCHYRIERPSVHSKVYVWMSGDTPLRAFVGSANYTQRAFLGMSQQQESMAEADPEQARTFFEWTLNGSMEIDHDDIEDHVVLFVPDQGRPGDDDCVTLSFLDSRGRVPARSGLNWGQRPGRHPDQAYLRIPANIARSEFFPNRATQFTVLADDGFSCIAVVAQDGDKAIETPDGNYILGEYFRRRIGVPLGTRVTTTHLENYGRTDIEMCKIDDETFSLDFSVQG